mmetsp:Transcript_107631/g.327200  ORF Transcript_107631/g.327200 Transcript_107631/m.327200 type:complete len:217 (-) Transcript_107631:404-1054(-)
MSRKRPASASWRLMALWSCSSASVRRSISSSTPTWLRQTSRQRTLLQPPTRTIVPWTPTQPWSPRAAHFGFRSSCHVMPLSRLYQASRSGLRLSKKPPVNTSVPPSPTTLCPVRPHHGGCGSSYHVSPWSSLRQASCIGVQLYMSLRVSATFPPVTITESPRTTAECPARGFQGGVGSLCHVDPRSALRHAVLIVPQDPSWPPRRRTIPLTAAAAA